MDLIDKLKEQSIFKAPSPEEKDKRGKEFLAMFGPDIHQVADFGENHRYWVKKLIAPKIKVTINADWKDSPVEVTGKHVLDIQNREAVIGDCEDGDIVAVKGEDGNWKDGGKYAIEVVDQDGTTFTFGTDAGGFVVH